jgi:hypothetical protein
VIARCNAAGQFLPLVLIFKDVNKKEEFGGGLRQTLDVYMNRKSSTLTRTFFRQVVHRAFPQHKTSGRVIPHSDGHRAYCSSPLLLHIAVENNVTIIRLRDHCTHTLQSLSK